MPNNYCPWFYRLLLELEKHTGAAILANTSCNVRGKPIVNSIVDVLQVSHIGNMCVTRVEQLCG